jgi:hypothetical protein
MNAQEHNQLTQFLKPLTEVRLPNKDPEAEKLILDAAKQQPDALYLLVQRALILEQALNNAKTQISDLQSQLQSRPSAAGERSGFLSQDPWAQASVNNGPGPSMGRYAEPRYAPPQQNGGFLGGGGSSFLGNVATTAAGVVAGSFLFQGIENLFNDHHSSSSWMDHAANHSEPASESNTTINNFYGDEAPESAMHEANYTDYNADEGAGEFQDDSGESDWI